MMEDQNTEFKAEFTEKLIKSVVAFSNTSGGRIVLGIDDDGNEVGLDDPDDVAKRCVNAIADKIRPDATLTTEVSIRQLGEKSLVVIDVSEGEKKPYYLRDKGLRAEGVYVRKGTASVPITEEGLLGMIRGLRAVSYETQTSFRQDLTFDELKRVFDERSVALDENRMSMMNMVENGKYTNLAFILSDQFDQSIKMASFDDEYRTGFIERSETYGCVLKQMGDAISFLKRYNTPSSRIEGIRRIDSYPYSEDSIREAMMNAVAHRDYSMDSPILVSVYPKKITITSPGGMKEYYTLDEMLRGVSSLRNRNLAGIMYRLGMIEAYGTGIPRIFGAYRGSEEKPMIENGVSSFTITLPSSRAEGRDDALQYFLDAHDEFTRAELQRALGMSRSRAVAVVGDLMDEGAVSMVGHGRSSRYRVNRLVRTVGVAASLPINNNRAVTRLVLR